MDEHTYLGRITKTLWYGAWVFPVVAALIASAFDGNWVLAYIITLMVNLGLLTVMCVVLGIVNTVRANRELTHRIENPGKDGMLTRPETADAGIGLFFAGMGSILAIIPYALAYSHELRGTEWIAFVLSTLPMLGCFWVAHYHLRRYALMRTAWKLRHPASRSDDVV